MSLATLGSSLSSELEAIVVPAWAWGVRAWLASAERQELDKYERIEHCVVILKSDTLSVLDEYCGVFSGTIAT